jgi:hypothetical protein
MNSRDAAFDESLKEIIEATAAEAAAIHDSRIVGSNGRTNGHIMAEENADAGPSYRNKRKRPNDDASAFRSCLRCLISCYLTSSISEKRTRSASSTSDHPAARDKTPLTTSGSHKTALLLVPTPKSTARNKKGGRKLAHEPALCIEGEEGIYIVHSLNLAHYRVRRSAS